MDLCNLSVIRSLMEEAGITFRKDFGQNFLINPQIPERIADAAAETPHSMLLEIGPGVGCLTAELAKRYDKVIAIEIDRGLIPVLEKTLAEYPNATVINDDCMKVDLPALIRQESEGMPVSVAANLPYYITTPILMHLLESGIRFGKITVMVQNEVASRLCAGAGDEDYGAITVILNYYGEVKRLFRVPAGCFVPAPKVDSAVVQITLFEKPKYTPKNETLMRGIIKAAFEMRRKTFVNAVSAKFPQYTKEKLAEALAAIGRPATVRGERLSIADFVELSDHLFEV